MLELNYAALDYLQTLIDSGRYNAYPDPFERHFSRQAALDYVDTYGWDAYSQWFVAIDEAAPEASLERYALPCGDLQRVSTAYLQRALDEAHQEGRVLLEAAIERLLLRVDED